MTESQAKGKAIVSPSRQGPASALGDMKPISSSEGTCRETEKMEKDLVVQE